jgi:adenylate cyclase class IV
MARNLELKVRCEDEARFAEIKRRALEAGAEPFVALRQIDAYFSAPNGRLKLREIEPDAGNASAELIGYRRPDTVASRWSEYERAVLPLDAAQGVKRALAAACDVWAVVKKRRDVGILGRTRIHLDQVEGLGLFAELETVIAEGEEESVVHAEHVSIVWLLGLESLPVVAGSYSDLIAKQKEEENNG